MKTEDAPADRVAAAHDELPPSPLDTGAPPLLPASPTGLSPTEKNWGMIGHLAALAGFTAIPFAHILGPMIVWLMKREESEFVRQNALEALNFNISITFWAVIAALTILVGIGVILLPLVLLAWLVLTVVGAMKAANGESYRYPATLRLVS
ncbi:MAG: DUF4870 domain-containing protein [Acidimicrobiia bacterium]|nr:DUF4870 domain-containing protein [Acidimicrobiia bacterium]